MFSCDDLRQIYGIEEDDEDIYVDDRILTVVNTASRLLRLLHSACRALGVSFEDSVWLNKGMMDDWEECQKCLIMHVIHAHNVFMCYRHVDDWSRLVGISVWSSGAHFLYGNCCTKAIDLDASDEALLLEINARLFNHQK